MLCFALCVGTEILADIQSLGLTDLTQHFEASPMLVSRVRVPYVAKEGSLGEERPDISLDNLQNLSHSDSHRPFYINRSQALKIRLNPGPGQAE